MRLAIVTTCTDRKRFAVPSRLDARRLGKGVQSALAAQWREHVAVAKPVAAAKSVYCGRSFKEAAEAAQATRGGLYVISGGLGFIGAEDEIPSYSLSLVRSSPDFVGHRIKEGEFDPARWWAQVQGKRAPWPLAKFVRANPNAIVAIAISSAYLELIADDLGSLETKHLERVRLVGLSIEGGCAADLRHCVIPYDDRFDGPDSSWRGTRGDFASRALRHFAEHVFSDNPTGSLEAHKSSVNRRLARWRHPKKISREPRSDEEIIALIKRTWKVTEGKSSRALRHLRDVEQIACEQSRFRDLFHRAAAQVNP